MSNLKIPRGYQEDFDPDWYLDAYYHTMQGSIEEGDPLPFFIDSLHHIFASGSIHGEKLLDIGTGPTVHSVISASRHVTEVHLSDFLDRNRAILQKWLKGGPNVIPIFEHIIKKENDGTTLDARVEAVRDKVKKIHPIDLCLPKPIEDPGCKYDVITSSLCLESVAKTLQSYADIVAKVADMLNPSGHFVLVGVLGQRFYRVGDFRFDCLNISGGELKHIITNAGFEIKNWLEAENASYIPNEQSTDCEGAFVMTAQKKH